MTPCARMHEVSGTRRLMLGHASWSRSTGVIAIMKRYFIDTHVDLIAFVLYYITLVLIPTVMSVLFVYISCIFTIFVTHI